MQDYLSLARQKSDSRRYARRQNEKECHISIAYFFYELDYCVLRLLSWGQTLYSSLAYHGRNLHVYTHDISNNHTEVHIS